MIRLSYFLTYFCLNFVILFLCFLQGGNMVVQDRYIGKLGHTYSVV
jgi:hypothetical protein